MHAIHRTRKISIGLSRYRSKDGIDTCLRSLAMFSRLLARVGVRCRFVSQQKGKGVGGNSLQRLLSVNIVRYSSGDIVGHGKQAARNSTSIVANESSRVIMSSNEKKPFRRLPTSVRPYHYDISLTPNLATLAFDGTEKVHIDVSVRASLLFRPLLPAGDSAIVERKRGKRR